MHHKRKNVLALCSDNSVRSIFAEALLNSRGQARLRAYSAGISPISYPHPLTLKILQEKGLAAYGYRSKSIDEFTLDGAPSLNLVLNFCENLKQENLPKLQGKPMKAQWLLPNPVLADETHQRTAFEMVFHQIEERIETFLDLPFENMDDLALKKALDDIAMIDEGMNFDGARRLA